MSTMRTLLITVGTSLLTNARRELKKQELNDQEIANYLRHSSPEQACAETNSLSRLLQEGDKLVFLHSQTKEGACCAKALVRHYVDAGYQADSLEIQDLTYVESRFKMRGLRSLVATLTRLIRTERKQNRAVLINATGGFKAEIAYATLVGLLFDVPVYYIHEEFQDIIEMPPTPIGWDYSLLAEYEEFFEWLHEDYRGAQEVEDRLRGLHRAQEIHLLLTEEDGYTFLSPTGEAFYEAYQARLEQAQRTPVWLSDSAWRTYDQAEEAVKKLFVRALKKLPLLELRKSGSDQVRNCDCLVFPKGHRDERIFYFEDEHGHIYVCELTRHSDQSYERAIQRGVKRSNYQNWRRFEVENRV